MADTQVQRNDAAMDTMAEEGRVTDDVMAHLTKGEIVVPLHIVRSLPAQQTLKMMFELSGFDIQEFIVGHPKNKINPKTKHPEFWGFSVGGVGISIGGGGVSVNVGDKKVSTTDVTDPVVNVAKDVVNTGVNVVKDVANTATNVTKDVVNTTTNVVNDTANTVTTAVKDTANTVSTVAKDVVALDPVAAVKDTASGVGTVTSDVASGVKSVGSDVVSGVKDVGGDVVQGVKDVGSDVVAGTKAVVKDAYTGVMHLTANLLDFLGVLPHAPTVGNTSGPTSSATVSTGDQNQRQQAVTDVQAAAGGGASSLTPRTVAGPDNDYKLNKSAVLGL